MNALTILLFLALLLAAVACAAPPAIPTPTATPRPTLTPTPVAPPSTVISPANPAPTGPAAAADRTDTGEPRRAIFDNEEELYHEGIGRFGGNTLYGCSGGTGADTSDPLEGLDSYEYDRPTASQLQCEAAARRQWLAQR